MLRLTISLAVLYFASTVSFAQQSSSPEWQTHVRLPIVVMEKNGSAVAGLHPDDFNISKGVKGAKVAGIKEVSPAEINGKRPIVILFDGIGNPPDVQKTTRDAILSYLGECIRQQQPISVIITTQNGPRLVHSSATPATVTLAALQRLDHITHALGGRFSSGLSPDQQSKLSDQIDSEFARLKDFEQKVEVATFYRTFSVQFEMLQLVGNGLMNAPGRKAVLWITSQFPVKVDEGQKLLALGNTSRARDTVEWWEMTTQYEKSVRLLNAAQISLYAAQPVKGFDGLQLGAGGFTGVGAPGNPTDMTFTGLSAITTQTGGMLIPFTTDVKKMVDIIEKDLGTYYLVDYDLPPPPSRIDWKELGIKVSKQGTRLRKADSLFLVADKTYYK
jgi:VWFA-related protein